MKSSTYCHKFHRLGPVNIFGRISMQGTESEEDRAFHFAWPMQVVMVYMRTKSL